MSRLTISGKWGDCRLLVIALSGCASRSSLCTRFFKFLKTSQCENLVTWDTKTQVWIKSYLKLHEKFVFKRFPKHNGFASYNVSCNIDLGTGAIYENSL